MTLRHFRQTDGAVTTRRRLAAESFFKKKNNKVALRFSLEVGWKMEAGVWKLPAVYVSMILHYSHMHLYLYLFSIQ